MRCLTGGEGEAGSEGKEEGGEQAPGTAVSGKPTPSL